MTDREPVFTDDDSSVEQEIRANEARDVPPQEPAVERTLDRIVSPVARMIQDDDLTPEEQAEVLRENDRDQQPG